jgi:hypothetical protein
MYSYSVIQAHTLLVLLLASLFAIACSYAWTAWTTECRVLVALAKPFGFLKNDIRDATLTSPTVTTVPGAPFVTNGSNLPAHPEVVGQHVASQSCCRAPKAADGVKTKDAAFRAAESLALIIAFSAVIALCLAIAGFLLGEQ